MSEREIRHFKYGREYIPTSLAESDTCRLVILTDDQIEVLGNLVNYAHDRRNWNDETIDSERYYMPSDDDWNDLESLVDNLEYQLMSDLDAVDGDLILGNVTPEWSKLAVSIPGADLINVLAVAHTDLRPNYKTASSNPGAAVAVLASNALGGITLTGHVAFGAQTVITTEMIARLTEQTAIETGQFMGLGIEVTSSPANDSIAAIKGAVVGTITAGSKNHADVRGVQSTLYHGSSGALTTGYGNVNAVVTQAGAGQANLLYGNWNQVSVAAGTTVLGARAVNAKILNSGTLTNAYGLFCELLHATGTCYGLYIEPQTGGAANYAIFTNAGKVRIGGEFGCNAATPQGKATVNAACTDLPTAVALVNQLRAALVANGICV